MNKQCEGKQTSCRLISRDLNIVPAAYIYIIKIICCIKRNKENLAQNVEVYNSDIQKYLIKEKCSECGN